MSFYVHGDNLSQKEKGKGKAKKKFTDPTSKKFLVEIRAKYDAWKKENIDLIGPGIEKKEEDEETIKKRVELFNNYKDFLDQQQYAEHFDSRSNLHSTVLEEFMFFLFRDLVKDCSEHALIGKSHSFKDIFFRNSNYKEMISKPNIMIETKNHDFVIGTTINASFSCKGEKKNDKKCFDVPAVVIECKTYFDKTMLEGSSTAAEQLKTRNPNAIYYVVAERLKLTEAVNLKKYKVDQIYVLRKEKNKDREDRYEENYVSNPIYSDVVNHLYEAIRDYLTTDWHGDVCDGIQKGYLLD